MSYTAFCLRLFGTHLTQDERYAIWQAAQKLKPKGNAEVRTELLKPIFDMVEEGIGAREILKYVQEEM